VPGHEEAFVAALIDTESKTIKFDFLQKFCDFYVYAPYMIKPNKNKSSIEMLSNFQTILQTDIRDSFSQARNDLLSSLLDLFWRRIEQRFSSLQKAFRYFDTSLDNTVEPEEFKNACFRLNLQFSKEELAMLFKKFDVQNEGFISYDNFVRLNGDQRGGQLIVKKPARRQI
jgi:hypothetical protein